MEFGSIKHLMNFIAYVGMKKKFPKPILVEVDQQDEIIHLTVNYDDLFTITWIGLKNIEDTLRCDMEDDSSCDRMIQVSYDLMNTDVTTVVINGQSTMLHDIKDDCLSTMIDVFINHVS